MTVVTRARALRGYGYKPAEIIRELANEGVTVSMDSVMRWTDAKHERRRQHQNRKSNQRKALRLGSQPMGPTHATPEYKLARMIALTECGMTYAMVALVMEFDFGDRLHQDQVRYAVRHRAYPKNDTARDALTRTPDPVVTTPCTKCGEAIPYSGRGRPRLTCDGCSSRVVTRPITL